MSERPDNNESAGEANRFRVGITLPPPPPGTRRPAVAAAAVRLKLDVFCRDLDDALTGAPLKVTPRVFKSYGALLDAVSKGDVELAWLPPLVAARTAAEHKIVPVAVPMRGEHAWYAAALFSAPDSKVKTLDDLKGVRVAWADPESMAGYLAVRAWLRSQEVDFEEAFSDETFMGGHDEVVAAVVDGRVDVGATFVHQDPEDDSIQNAGWGALDVQVIGVTDRIPADLLAARAGVEAEVIEAVRNALTGDMNSALRGAALALFEADCFAPADEQAMKTLTALVEYLEEPKA